MPRRWPLQRRVRHDSWQDHVMQPTDPAEGRDDPAVRDDILRLTRALKDTPPASLEQVDPAVITTLALAVEAEDARSVQAIAQAVEDALRLVPRPFRGIVRKLVQP